MSAGGNDKETKPVDDVEDCVICFEALTNSDRTVVTLQCRHQFHLDCIGSAFNEKNKMICPCCRQIEKGEWLYANAVDPSIPAVGNINWNYANAVHPPVIYWDWDYSEDEGIDNQSLQEMQPIEQNESGLSANAVDPSYPPVTNLDDHIEFGWEIVDAEVGVDDQTLQELTESGLPPSVEGDIDNDDVNIVYVEAEVRVDDQEMTPIEQSESELPPGFEVFEVDISPMETRLSSQITEPLGTGRESNVEGDSGGRSLGEESG